MRTQSFSIPWGIGCLLILVAAYAGSYVAFRTVHTFHLSGATVPAVIVSSGPGGSFLPIVFYPAICLDARFGPPCIFYRTIRSNGQWKVDSSRYPFATLPSMHVWPRQPNDSPEELPLVPK